jgi:hypothetical protein
MPTEIAGGSVHPFLKTRGTPTIEESYFSISSEDFYPPLLPSWDSETSPIICGFVSAFGHSPFKANCGRAGGLTKIKASLIGP